ncbi:uncharacterized protein [Hyperolius riggenbachi]|uniref:uncharacterized protein n=1 Tax=Hyperolius riggenbachi TaxID=752182 RepID=UPI0035A2B11A
MMVSPSSTKPRPLQDSRLKMDKDKRILQLTLEIICLLIGEDCTVVKKSSGDHVGSSSHLHVSGLSKSRILGLTPPSLISERKSKTILEVINKMIELLTGEVPIRCQDVTLYFSMEEWQYLEGHKDLYREVMMEHEPLLTSLDCPNNINLKERSTSPLYFRDSAQEHRSQSQDYQDEELIVIKVEAVDEEETCVTGDEMCKEEEILPEISTDGHHRDNCTEEHSLISLDGKTKEDFTRDSSRGDDITPDLLPERLTADPSMLGGSLSDHAPSIIHHTMHNVGSMFKFSAYDNVSRKMESLFPIRLLRRVTIRMPVQSVEKFSFRSPTLSPIRESTREKSLTHVLSVGNVSLTKQTSYNMRGFTLVTTRSLVLSVGNLSNRRPIWPSITELILGKSLTHAHFVGGVLPRSLTWSSIRGSTQGRNRMPVRSVENVSQRNRL